MAVCCNGMVYLDILTKSPADGDLVDLQLLRIVVWGNEWAEYLLPIQKLSNLKVGHQAARTTDQEQTAVDVAPTPPAHRQDAHIPASAATQDDWLTFGEFDYLSSRDPMPSWVHLPQDPPPHVQESHPRHPYLAILDPQVAERYFGGAAFPFIPTSAATRDDWVTFDVLDYLTPRDPMPSWTYAPVSPARACASCPVLAAFAAMPVDPSAQAAGGFGGHSAFPAVPTDVPITSMPAPIPQQRTRPRVPSVLYKNHMANLMWMELNKRNDPRPVVTDRRPEPLTSFDYLPAYPTLHPAPTFVQRKIENARQVPGKIKTWLHGISHPVRRSAMHDQIAVLASERDQAMSAGLLYRECEYPCNCLRCFRASCGNTACLAA